MTRAAPASGPGGFVARAARVVARDRTSRRSTPRRCRSSGAGRSRWAGTRPPARCRRTRPPPCPAPGSVPWKTFMRCSPPGSSSSPHGKRRLDEPAAGGVLPLGLGRQARAGPARRTPARRSRRCGPRDGRVARRRSDCGPSGWAQSAPSHLAPPRRADDRAGGGEVVGQQAGEDERPAEPLGLRAVTRRLRRTPRTAAFVTAWRAIANGASSTSCAGPSPSCG